MVRGDGANSAAADSRADGIRYRFFYVHIRGGIRFHFLDLHMDGRINLHGGSGASMRVRASGWHGFWEPDSHWMGADHYVGAMRLSFSYLGNAAFELHHIYAAQCRYNRDCWVAYEDGFPHAIMYRLDRPEGRVVVRGGIPIYVNGVQHAWQIHFEEMD